MWVNFCFSFEILHLFSQAPSYTLSFSRMLHQDLIFLPHWKSVRSTWAMQNLKLIQVVAGTSPASGVLWLWELSNLIILLTEPAVNLSTELTHFTALPFVHAWLTHNIQSVSLFIMSTLCSRPQHRSQTSRKAVTYFCHLMCLPILHGFWLVCFSCWSPTLTWRVLLHKSICDTILPSREGHLKMENVWNRGALIQYHLFFFPAHPCKDGWVRSKLIFLLKSWRLHCSLQWEAAYQTEKNI